MPFNVLILAGSRGGTDPVAAAAGVSDKALVEIGGRPMLARVVAAVRAAGARRIAVVARGQAADLAHALACEVLPQAEGPSSSAAAGLALLGAPLLLTTGDHALLQAEWIADFLARVPSDCDVAALLARRATIERDAPQMHRTYYRFADGGWSSCNLFHLGTARAAAAIGFWQRIEAQRKRPWRIAGAIGAGTLARYALGRLTLDEAVHRLGARIGVSARAVETPFGWAALDVDKPGDLAIARARIGAG